MPQERKSEEEAKALGRALHRRRADASLTLQQVCEETHIDVGQLSRFERGAFKKLSSNLQKYQLFLQTQGSAVEFEPNNEDLSKAVLRLAERSARHRAAAQALLRALESLN